jgi:hypothetical protein
MELRVKAPKNQATPTQTTYTELNLAWLQNSMSQHYSSAIAMKLDIMRNWVRNGADNG